MNNPVQYPCPGFLAEKDIFACRKMGDGHITGQGPCSTCLGCGLVTAGKLKSLGIEWRKKNPPSRLVDTTRGKRS